MTLRGTIGDAGVPGRDDTFVVDVHTIVARSGAWEVSGAVVVQPRTPVTALPGDVVDVQTAALRAPPRRPGALSAVALERIGVTGVAGAAQVTLLAAGGPTPARLAEQLRRGLAAAVARTLPEPEATLLLGIAFGIHGKLAGAVHAPLQEAGLVHIVAVSGLKVVMVAGFVNALGQARRWPRRRRTVATVAVIALYVLVSGAGAAALRSSLMVTLAILLGRDGRRLHSFAALAAVSAFLLALAPALATDVGFQLSFIGTAGILLLSDRIAAHLPGPQIFAEPVAVTIAAQLATAPVTAGTFGALSLVGPVANGLVLPLLPVTILSGGLGSLVALVVPAAGWLPLQLAATVTRAILAVAQGAAAMPFASVPVSMWPGQWTVAEIAALCAGAAVWLWRTRSLPGGKPLLSALTAAAVAGSTATFVVGSASSHSLRVTVLDVGNGVAVLIRPPGGGSVLVDGGADGVALLSALGRVLSPFDRRLDAVVLTAVDRATSAAIASLIGHYTIGSLLVSQPLPPALEGTAASMAGTGTRVDVVGAASWLLGGLRGRCLSSGPSLGSPCALQATDGRSTVLVTGNIPQAAQDELAAVHRGMLGCDLLVAPTTTAVAGALLGAARPPLIAVPARRMPPGLGTAVADIAVTGRDRDLAYDALAAGGFGAPWA